MKYLCLIYVMEKELAAISKNEMDTLLDATSVYNDKIRSLHLKD